MYFACIKKKSLIAVAVAIIVCIVSLAVLSGTGAANVFYGKGLRKLPIYSVETKENKIAISFDCAWGVDYTDKLLEIMEKENVKSTFFAVEFWSEKYPEYLKKISEAGHEIGTHSATHPYMSKLSEEEITKELTTSSYAIEKVTGKKVELFRPPYGDYNDRVIATSEKMGLYPIQWSVDSLDWKNISAKEIENRVIKKLKAGSIVLFHNQGLNTCEALPTIISAAKEKGLEFVTIGELIYRQNYTMLPDGTQRVVS